MKHELALRKHFSELRIMLISTPFARTAIVVITIYNNIACVNSER